MDKLIMMGVTAALLVACQTNYKVPVDDDSTVANTPPRTYTATANDNLFVVSMKYNLDYQKLGKKNGIKYPYRLRKGQKIILSGEGKGTTDTTDLSSSEINTDAIATSKPNRRVHTSPKPGKSVEKEITLAPAKIASKTKKVYGIRWQWPVKGKVVQTFASSPADYKGIDITAAKGTKVYAAASGIVVYAGDDGLAKYGKLIIINHNDEALSAYAHNNKLLVDEGQEVKRGQAIATMGSSGTNKVKLHFEIRKDGESVNPQNILP